MFRAVKSFIGIKMRLGISIINTDSLFIFRHQDDLFLSVENRVRYSECVRGEEIFARM